VELISCRVVSGVDQLQGAVPPEIEGIAIIFTAISDHQQSWGYEDGPWKGPGPPLLVAADC